jgi:hypothetical protein
MRARGARQHDSLGVVPAGLAREYAGCGDGDLSEADQAAARTAATTSGSGAATAVRANRVTCATALLSPSSPAERAFLP